MLIQFYNSSDLRDIGEPVKTHFTPFHIHKKVITYKNYKGNFYVSKNRVDISPELREVEELVKTYFKFNHLGDEIVFLQIGLEKIQNLGLRYLFVRIIL